MKKLTFITLALITLLIAGCRKEDLNPKEDTQLIREKINKKVRQDIIPQNVLELAQQVCPMEMSEDVSPNTEWLGKYFLADKWTLKCANNDDFKIGHKFMSTVYLVNNFNPNTFTVDMASVLENGDSEKSEKAYLLGNGNIFTIYSSTIMTYSGQKAKTAQIYSGEYTPEGIKNLKHHLVIIDNDYDKDGNVQHFAKNNTVRQFDEADAIAKFVSGFPKAQTAMSVKNGIATSQSGSNRAYQKVIH